jgi:hypothetical protein
MVRLTQHLFTLFAAFSVILSAAATPTGTTTMDMSPRRDTSAGLMTRGSVKSGTVCDSVAIIIKIGHVKYVSATVVVKYQGSPVALDRSRQHLLVHGEWCDRESSLACPAERR